MSRTKNNHGHFHTSINCWDSTTKLQNCTKLSDNNVNEIIDKFPSIAEDSKLNHIHIPEHIQKFPVDVKNEIVSILRTGIITENVLSVDQIEHFLAVSQYSNPLKTACEEKLLRTLSASNCWNFLSIAERFGLLLLRDAAIAHIENGCLKALVECPHIVENAGQSTDDGYRHYNVLFTIKQSKQAVQAIVLDSSQDVRCYRNLKQGKKITHEFRVCCLHDDVEDTPYMFWSCGKTVSRYDPIANTSKRCKPLKLRHCNFTMVAHNRRCYVIGGSYKGQNNQDIDQFDVDRKKWTKIAKLPPNVKTTNTACVVVADLIYILTPIIRNVISDECGMAVCTFNPEREIVNIIAKIPFRFNQIKACVHGRYIYVASDEGHFFRFNTVDNSVIMLQSPFFQCKDFGMYSCESSIFLVGGVNIDGTLNDVISKYCTVTGGWQRLHKRLPDKLSIYGSGVVKVPKCSETAITFVPFYENNYLEIW